MLKNNDVYGKLDEGLGGAYERIAYSAMIMRIAKEFKCQSILELDATYIAGIPAFNSCIIAQKGFDTHVAVQNRDMEDAEEIWGMTELRDKVKLYEIESGAKTDFKDGQFDLVWNHLAFEQYNNPVAFVNEMKRISKKVVINLTLNPFNYGYWIHWVNHKFRRQYWNHGKASAATYNAIQKVHNECGLTEIEHGIVDMPFWMDTVNAIIGNGMTYADVLPESQRNKWVWCSANPECQEHKLVKMMLDWEQGFPAWFQILGSHHLYVASVK